MIFSFAEFPRFMRVMIINAQVSWNNRNSTPSKKRKWHLFSGTGCTYIEK